MVDWQFKHLLFGFILFVLFGTLVLMAVKNQADVYGKDTSEVLGGSLDYYKFNQSVSTVGETGENLRQQFEKQNIFSTVTGIVLTGMFDVVKSMILMIFAPFQLIAGILTTIHVPSIVINVILGLIAIAVIFGIWELLKIN